MYDQIDYNADSGEEPMTHNDIGSKCPIATLLSCLVSMHCWQPFSAKFCYEHKHSELQAAIIRAHKLHLWSESAQTWMS